MEDHLVDYEEIQEFQSDEAWSIASRMDAILEAQRDMQAAGESDAVNTLQRRLEILAKELVSIREKHELERDYQRGKSCFFADIQEFVGIVRHHWKDAVEQDPQDQGILSLLDTLEKRLKWYPEQLEDRNAALEKRIKVLERFEHVFAGKPDDS